MRALIVAGSPAVDPRRVAVLAAACDLIVAADSGAAACIEADVTPAILVGDMDSIDASTLAAIERRGTEVVRHPVVKDETDLDLAITLARQRGCTRVAFTGVMGGRTDHEIAALGSVASAHDLEPLIDESDLRGWTLSRLGRRTLDLAGADATISVFAWGRRARVRSKGLAWPLDGVWLEPFGSRGVSNRIASSPALIEWRSGLAVVLSPQVGDVPAARVSTRG